MGHKDTVKSFFERVWNAYEKSAMGTFLVEDVTVRGSLGDQVKGFEALGDYIDRVNAVLGDFRCTVEDAVAEDDRVFAKMLYTAIHKGELLGHPPTGRPVRWWGAALFTFEGDRIADVWIVGNQKALELQLVGLEGTPGKGWGL